MNTKQIVFAFNLILYSVFILVCILKNVTCITSSYEYFTFEISDWLINYEGGFVRRGLVGEILYVLYSVTPFSVKTAIKIICCLSFIAILFLVQRAGSFLKVSILPFFTVFCSNMVDLLWYRRDFLVLFIAYYVILFHIKCLKNGKNGPYFFVLQFLMILILLIHEGSFFFIFPVLFIITWFYYPGALINRKRITCCLKFFIVPFLSMAFICLMKGNKEIASSIWLSWAPLFTMYPEDSMPYIGVGVNWLTCDLKEATTIHLNLNFQSHLGVFAVAKSIVLLCISLFFIYFITLRNLYIDISKKCLNDSNNNCYVANILLLQFLFMIPMFTILSTDYPRTVLYCIATSVFFIYSIKRYDIELHLPKLCVNISFHISNYINKSRILRSPWVYFSFIILYPISLFGSISIPDNMLLYKYLSFIKNCIL